MAALRVLTILHSPVKLDLILLYTSFILEDRYKQSQSDWKLLRVPSKKRNNLSPVWTENWKTPARSCWEGIMSE